MVPQIPFSKTQRMIWPLGAGLFGALLLAGITTMLLILFRERNKAITHMAGVMPVREEDDSKLDGVTTLTLTIVELVDVPLRTFVWKR